MTDERIITVGVDGSVDSAAAVQWAAGEAALRGASLKLVHAWLPPSGYAIPAGVVVDEAMADLRAAKASLADHDVPVQTKLIEGPVIKTLCAEAEGSDLLVLGSFGRGRLAGAVLGSVSAGCIHRARCPVVVIPHAVTRASFPHYPRQQRAMS